MDKWQELSLWLHTRSHLDPKTVTLIFEEMEKIENNNGTWVTYLRETNLESIETILKAIEALGIGIENREPLQHYLAENMECANWLLEKFIADFKPSNKLNGKFYLNFKEDIYCSEVQLIYRQKSYENFDFNIDLLELSDNLNKSSLQDIFWIVVVTDYKMI